MALSTAPEYAYRDAAHAGSHSYLWPAVERVAGAVHAAGGRRAILRRA